MKKYLFFAAVTLLAFAAAASAQDKAASFAGTWTLDVGRSSLGERNMIESQTLTVTQTDKEITVTPQTKRMAPPDGGGGRGGRMGGGFGGGDMATTYGLDGKETKTEVEGPMGKMPVSLKANLEGAKLHLTQTRTFNGPMGEMTITTKETWSLSEDGKTLTVDRESTTPRGTNSTKMVYSKN